jgi:subtilisin family serine protease
MLSKRIYTMRKTLIILNIILAIGLTYGQNAKIDWFHLDPSEGFNGVSSQKTIKEKLKGTGKTVVVAIIDSGIDFNHEDLKDNIWINAGEIPGNGIDDDKNGYIDDVNGWSFIGGPNGKNVAGDTYEVTRVYGSLLYKYKDADPSKLNKTQKAEYDLYLKTKKEVEESKAEAQEQLKQFIDIENRAVAALKLVEEKLKDSKLTLGEAGSINVSQSTELAYGVNIIKRMTQNRKGLTTVEQVREFLTFDLLEARRDAEKKIKIAYNTDFDPRSTIVMDDYNNKLEKIYGNNDVIGPDALHGTHVGGIVGAVRDNNIGMDGIAPNVKLMVIRAVPDGDERDKDVANAIRYAVDNGASIINMSFGKGYSPEKNIVDEAVKYAEKNDVLLVHAAGNSAANNDTEPNFPNAYLGKSGFIFKKKRYAKNWIEVGALSFKKDADMVASFSNFGGKSVDIFAPGVQIFATTPNNQYRFLQGTSMAAPVVSGVAAVIRSHFPTLSATQVKSVLMNSVVPFTNMVKEPGSGKEVPFNTLSVSGGVVNLYKAYELAEKTKGKKKIKVSGV